MTNPTIELARDIARFAPDGMRYEDAVKLVMNRRPKTNEIDASILARWVCNFARPQSTVQSPPKVYK